VRLGLLLLFGTLLTYRLHCWKQSERLTGTFCGSLALRTATRETGPRIQVRAQSQSSLKTAPAFSDPEIRVLGRWHPFDGKLVIPEEIEVGIPKNQKILIQGNFECDVPLRNFGDVQDGIFKLASRRLILKRGHSSWTVLPEEESPVFSWGKKFRGFLRTRFEFYPNLQGIVWAVWTGDAQGLDPELIAMYREGGLLPLVALSGQHVGIWVLVFRALSGVVVRSLFFVRALRSFYRHLLVLFPVLGSLVLTISSAGTPSVLRTLAMALSVCLIRLRKGNAPTVQVVCSSAALLIAMDPGLLKGISFMLSLAGTYLLVSVMEVNNLKSAFQKYLWVSVVMSVLSSPLILFYFGRWSFLAPLCSIVLSWVWGLVIIPGGFLVPALVVLPSGLRVPTFRLLDQGWKCLSQVQLVLAEGIHQTFFSYVRPTVWETFALQMTCLILFRFWMKDKKEGWIR
jgi:ComEC/Rec2-related protein